MRSGAQWREYLKSEEARAFTGWNPSFLKGRQTQEPLPWGYRERVKAFLKSDTQLLHMGTGDGEFLLSLGHPYTQTTVTEGYEPNYKLCINRLRPMGIEVYGTKGSDKLPFGDARFDVLINRHESYNMSEACRVLKPGGFFITQQVGGRNNSALSYKLIKGFKPNMPDFNLENQLPAFEKNGFRIMYKNQSYTRAWFKDLGALCYFAKVTPWEFPGFSVDTCFAELMALQNEIDNRGAVETEYHRFILIAKKTCRN